MKERIVILQNEIMAYRKPLYNMLAEHYRVMIIHAGRPSITRADAYEETIIPARRIGPFFIQNPWRLKGAISDADAVIAMFDLRWPAYLTPMSKGGGRYILWGHRYSKIRLANAVRDHFMKRADKILLYGSEEIEQMTARGIPSDRIFVAPNTIHVPNHIDHSSHPKHSLLFVGRLQLRKRIDRLIEAFARLQGRIPENTVLDIAGGGDLMPSLKALAQARGIAARVRFHGPVTDHEALSRLFATAYAYISPGPVGLSVLHSFAYGVPVITRRHERHGPELENIEHERNSIVYNAPNELEDVIQRICTQPLLSTALGQRAYQRYQERTLQHMQDGFRLVIDN